MKAVVELHQSLQREVSKAVVGQDEAVRLLAIAILCDGHVLLEGVPGVAKTTIARAVAAALGLGFRRVQFTPDLMPSDIVGTQIFAFQESRFHLVEGPIFTHVLLADEINRAPAKTQAALLEAMQERQVSIEGKGRPLPDPFFVVATQNPIEHQGTYPLPEAQLDRFLFRVRVGYPSEQQEFELLLKYRSGSTDHSAKLAEIEPIVTAEQLTVAKNEAASVRIDDEIVRYLIEIVRETRATERLQRGASPRASLLLKAAAQTAAALDGRDYVIPDDVKALIEPVLAHRVELTAAAEVNGIVAGELLAQIADSVAVPR